MSSCARSDLAYGETANPSFIRELCIALEHRWRPERLFVILTAYGDESDTHGRQPNMATAAFLGSGRQWELFNRRMGRLREAHGFKTFHATEFAGRRGEFKGWSDSKCYNLASELIDLVADELRAGVVTRFPHDLYKDNFLGKLPPKMPRASQYGLCFRATLEHLVRVVSGMSGSHRLFIVMENHNNFGDALRIYDEMKPIYEASGINFLRSLTPASKKDAAELESADFLGHSITWAYRDNKGKRPGYLDTEGKKKTNMNFQEINAEWLEGLRDEFVAKKSAAHDDYLRRSAASKENKK